MLSSHEVKDEMVDGGSFDEALEEGQIKKLSIQDVQKHTPSESAEEARVLRSLEQTVGRCSSAGCRTGPPSRASSFTSTSQISILECLPQSCASIFTNSSNIQSGDAQSARESKANSNKDETKYEPESVEDELFDLTNQMAGAFGEDENQQDSKTPEGGVAESFAGNADHIMNQARGNKAGSNQGSTSGFHVPRFQNFMAFLEDTRYARTLYIKWVMILILLATAVSVLLFYALGNPGGHKKDPTKASVSWWLLFVFVRQPITLSLAKFSEAFLVDFLCLRHPVFIRIIGPFFTLLLVQAKGLPLQMIMWGLINCLMLYGDDPFVRHWLFYQHSIGLFNSDNPAGNVLEALVYKNLLLIAMIGCTAIAVKRFAMGLYYGQNVYNRYGKELMLLMKKCIIIGNVARLANNVTSKVANQKSSLHLDYEILSKDEDSDEDDHSTDGESSESRELLIDTRRRNVFSGTLAFSQQVRIRDLLGEWEDPNADDERLHNKPSISAIVQFRAAASALDTTRPFSSAFGPAASREEAIDSSQKLYHRLMGERDDGELHFNDIALVAVKEHGKLDETLIKELIAVFRPTRDGELTMLDFVKAIDTVYKEQRVMRASIMNAQKMNQASQRLWNVLFNFVFALVLLGAIGVDPLLLVSSTFAFIVGISFMVGSAFAKGFEGLLFILMRKPYDVGDRIAISSCDKDSSPTGSSGWIVKDIDLYNTTVIFGTTGEEATITNGYLNEYRIINMNRSPKAVLSFVMKFGIDVDKSKIDAFGKAVEEYVKERPREWLAFSAYRLLNVEADLGYVEYKIILQHRESWQQIGALLTSKADVQSFAFETSKDLGMDYESPAMPIILRKQHGIKLESEVDSDGDALLKKFK